ncbi:MAG: hypothetical protein AAGM22_17690 [Acidobacteriota bacterium]
MNHAPLLAMALVAGLALSPSDPGVLHAQEAKPPRMAPGVYEVTLLGVASPERVQELTQNIIEAQRTNPEWFQNYVLEHGHSGEVLPWHQNLGLTREEYAEYLEIADSWDLSPVGQGSLEILKDGQRVEFIAGDELAALDGAVLDLQPLRLSSSFGDCEAFTQITAKAGQKPEPWSGVNCRATLRDSPFARTLVFSLGRLEASGDLFLRFEGKEAKNGELTRQADLFFTIP